MEEPEFFHKEKYNVIGNSTKRKQNQEVFPLTLSKF